AEIAFAFRILLETIRVAAVALRKRLGQVRDLAAVDDALPRRHRELSAELEQDRIVRDVRLEVPVGRVERLPRAAQIRVTVGRARNLRQKALRTRARRRGARERRPKRAPRHHSPPSGTAVPWKNSARPSANVMSRPTAR